MGDRVSVRPLNAARRADRAIVDVIVETARQNRLQRGEEGLSANQDRAALAIGEVEDQFTTLGTKLAHLDPEDRFGFRSANTPRALFERIEAFIAQRVPKGAWADLAARFSESVSAVQKIVARLPRDRIIIRLSAFDRMESLARQLVIHNPAGLLSTLVTVAASPGSQAIAGRLSDLLGTLYADRALLPLLAQWQTTGQSNDLRAVLSVYVRRFGRDAWVAQIFQHAPPAAVDLLFDIWPAGSDVHTIGTKRIALVLSAVERLLASPYPADHAKALALLGSARWYPVLADRVGEMKVAGRERILPLLSAPMKRAMHEASSGPDPSVRAMAVRATTLWLGPETLFETLADPDATVRATALETQLAVMPWLPEPGLPVWDTSSSCIAMLQQIMREDPHATNRLHATRLLASAAPESDVVTFLTHDDVEIQTRAVSALLAMNTPRQRVPTDALPALSRLIDFKHSALRMGAMQLILIDHHLSAFPKVAEQLIRDLSTADTSSSAGLEAARDFVLWVPWAIRRSGSVDLQAQDRLLASANALLKTLAHSIRDPSLSMRSEALRVAVSVAHLVREARLPAATDMIASARAILDQPGTTTQEIGAAYDIVGRGDPDGPHRLAKIGLQWLHAPSMTSEQENLLNDHILPYLLSDRTENYVQSELLQRYGRVARRVTGGGEPPSAVILACLRTWIERLRPAIDIAGQRTPRTDLYKRAAVTLASYGGVEAVPDLRAVMELYGVPIDFSDTDMDEALRDHYHELAAVYLKMLVL